MVRLLGHASQVSPLQRGQLPRLIMYQNPYATQVAGYKVWQSLGRQVRKGEHGLRILAPLAVKDKENGETNIKGFRGVSVFDISQTDGEELPEVATLLKGDDPTSAFTDLAEIGGPGF